MTEIHLTLENNASFGEMKRALKSALDEHTAETLRDPEFDINIHPADHYAHPNWERGDPCPNCGSTEMLVGELMHSRYESRDDWFDHIKGVNMESPMLHISCAEYDCDTILYETLGYEL